MYNKTELVNKIQRQKDCTDDIVDWWYLLKLHFAHKSVTRYS